MRTSKSVSITMPAGILQQARRLARKESRTVSELVREALRRYLREQTWDEINAYGRARAKDLGLTEQDVVPLIHEFRSEERENKRAGRSPR